MSNNTATLTSYIKSTILEYKIYLISLCAIAITASSFAVSVQYKIKEIIDSITANPNADLARLLGLFVLYKFLHHGMFFISRLLDIKYKPGLITKFTSDIYRKTINHSLHWFDSHLSGEISDKINGFQTNLTFLITNLFRSLVMLAAIVLGIAFLFRVSSLSAIVELLFIVIYSPLMILLLKKQMQLQENYVKANQETTGIINDSITNIFSIKMIGNIFTEFKLKLTPALLRRQEWDKKTRKFDAFFVDNADTVMIVIMAASQFYLLAHLYQTGQITAGGFTFVTMIVFQINGDLDQILEKLLFDINPQIAGIKSSYSFVNDKYDIIDQEEAAELKNVKGRVSFENVNFTYDKNKPSVLDGFNLTIKAGEKIGLVGHSGAGKTTLTKCLLRYFDIQSGNILIDDKKITEITQESLRANIAIIPQDITMFHRSILENLQFAKYEASKEEIIEACKKARIHDDIMNMKDGYDSIVGERGVKVSGGQRQRIAIARAILKDAPILILDEATSSLDSYTEKKIQESLNLLIEDKTKTLIAIAHRLSTLKHMDRIIVLDKGKIVEQGSHEELIGNDASLYKKLWKLQEI